MLKGRLRGLMEINTHATITLLNKNRRRKPEAKRRAPGYRAAATAEYKRAFERLFGSQGAASPVRRIDPVTGEVIGIIDTTDKSGSRPA